MRRIFSGFDEHMGGKFESSQTSSDAEGFWGYVQNRPAARGMKRERIDRGKDPTTESLKGGASAFTKDSFRPRGDRCGTDRDRAYVGASARP